MLFVGHDGFKIKPKEKTSVVFVTATNDILCIHRYKHESISPLDDLAFDMYQDPEVAHIIRLLDEKKQEMVRLERYQLAKKLKQAIADLQKVFFPWNHNK